MVSDLPGTPEQMPGTQPQGKPRKHRQPPPTWLGTLFFGIMFGAALITFYAAAAGATRFALETAVITLAATITTGSARMLRAPVMIMVGAAELSLSIAAISWDSPAGAVLIASGAVAIVFGAAIIGTRTIVARVRRLAQWATRARRT